MNAHHVNLLLRPCQTPDQLHAWVRLFTGLNVPRRAVCDGHDAPFDYLCHAYFEPARDVVTWAPRGGGKTRLAAVATLLDLLHKPGTSVRVLGGSLEQSCKLWDYLLPDLTRLAGHLLTVRPREGSRRVRLTNGSTAAVLAQSQRSVRGLRVQKLRCDEVELFDPDVWEAAQLTTRSAGGVAGAVEAASTFHRAGGLMGRVIASAQSREVRVVRWCLLDVLARCGPERSCDGCPLFAECGGRAKTECDGFVPIDDAIAMKGRVSAECWRAEMLCERPSRRGCVFPSFDAGLHVRPFDRATFERESRVHGAAGRAAEPVVLGVDFGFAAPFVALWIAVRGEGDGRALHVVDEYVQRERTTPEHAAVLRSRGWPIGTIYCDPAGVQRNGHTGASDVAVLKDAGFVVRHRASRIVEGLELIRRLLRPASGPPRLFVDPRCKTLIRSFAGYHYPNSGGELPAKDGEHDHAIDALRYAIVNLHAPAGRVRVRAY